jgi:TolB protein
MARRFAVVIGIAAVGVIALGAQTASATFPGTDGRIAFEGFVEQTESVEIYTAKPNGDDVQQLTSNPNVFSELPDWSPDGQRIAFQRERLDGEEPVQIHVMNADGSDVTQLTRGPGFHGAPGWSPDAASLAIEADWGDYPALQGIWIIPAFDPGGVTQAEAQRVTTIPKGLGFDGEPQFSPDGSSIVFTRFKSARKSAIHTVGIDGTGLERLTKWKLNASDPDWSPNGKKITFDSGDFGGETDGGGNIHVMRADGSKRKKLTDHPRVRKGDGEPFKVANNPVWSPSGTRIMFTRFLPDRTKQVAMRPNGSRKHVILDRLRFTNKVDWGTHP